MLLGTLGKRKSLSQAVMDWETKRIFSKMCELCKRLHAAAAVTRKVVDEGWAPSEIQVGQTGKNSGAGTVHRFWHFRRAAAYAGG